jgi:diguanylate cyclase (GGDEF)-like protein/PAS domain S-box-containing protein
MYRILLIENSHTQRFALYQTLQEAGYDPVECQDYWQAINILRVSEPHEWRSIVFGWVENEPELLGLLKSAFDAPGWAEVPLIALTDEPSQELEAWLPAHPQSRRLDHAQHAELLDHLSWLQHRNGPGVDQHGMARSNGVNVLLLDDSGNDSTRYELILRSARYYVSVAKTVDSALQAVSNQNFDVLLVDYPMLDTKAGRSFIQHVRSNPKLTRLRMIVMISAYDDKVVQESLELGAAECIFKTETDKLFLARIDALARLIVLQKTSEAERHRFEAIIGSVGEGVYGVDIKGKITFLNPAGRRMLGFQKSEEYIGKLAKEIIHLPDSKRRDDTENVDELTNAYLSGSEMTHWETLFTQVDGHKMSVVCTVAPLLVNGVRQGSVVAFRDITDRKRMERRLVWQATRDPLTDLYNRRYFEQALSREINKINQNPTVRSALLYIDFDQFKYLNDIAGHDAGDKLLLEASQRLKEYVRTSDDVARLGGDEFAVILRDVTEDEATQIAEHLRNMLQEVAYISEEISFKLSISIGIAMIEANKQYKEILANADVACGLAKRRGRNQSYLYTETTDVDKKSMNEEITWSSRLSKALESDGFTLVYQPILPIKEVDLDKLPDEPNRLWDAYSHLPDHYEVLVRLKDDSDEDVVNSSAFLSMAERFNFIQHIDLWVVKESIAVLEKLREEGRSVSFSVNLSGSSLNSKEILQEIEKKLEASFLPPSALMFEITETSAIEKMDVARNFIESMRDQGRRFALDDFGTGFSSFSQLKHLPVDVVKIDGQFVRDMSIDPIDRAIVIAINEIAHSLGMETVAEYVETAEILQLLAECGVDSAQGHYVREPMINIDERDQ